MPSMPSILLRDVSFSYPGGPSILESVTLHLTPGLTGVVGENGAGKTTLLSLLSGRQKPSAGLCVIEPKAPRIAVCSQTAEVLSEEIARFADEPSKLAQKLRGRLGLGAEALERFSVLSPGERKRWQIGAALASEPDLLLLDEPETHLDQEARALVRSALASFDGIGLLVSHDRAFLQALTQNTIRFSQGTARLWKGPYEQAREAWEAEEAYRVSVREKLVSEQRKLEKRLVAARDEQAAADRARSSRARMKSIHDHDARGALAKGRALAAEKKAGRSVQVTLAKLERQKEATSAHACAKELGGNLFFGFVPPTNPWLFRLEEPELRRGETSVLKDVRVSIARSARIRIEGSNGAGKTTLLTALAERATLPDDRFVFLRQDMTRQERLAVVAAIKCLGPEEKGRVLSIAATLGFDPDKLRSLVDPSPGEARKLVIALGLGRHVAALLLDEPENHLDLPSRERLERALAGYPGAIVMVSHDPYFAKALSTSVLRIEGGKVLS